MLWSGAGRPMYFSMFFSDLGQGTSLGFERHLHRMMRGPLAPAQSRVLTGFRELHCCLVVRASWTSWPFSMVVNMAGIE